MKIYQLHKIGGLWEDSYDYIIGSYLRKERAEEELGKAKAKEEKLMLKSGQCEMCPFVGEEKCELDNLLSKYYDYCSDMKLSEDDDPYLYCENKYYHWDNSFFEITEVEVEE